MAMIVNIQAKCVVRGNLDDKEKWPTIFSCRPVVGDIVCSEGGVELPITSIKHASEVKERDGEPWQFPKMTLVLG